MQADTSTRQTRQWQGGRGEVRKKEIRNRYFTNWLLSFPDYKALLNIGGTPKIYFLKQWQCYTEIMIWTNQNPRDDTNEKHTGMRYDTEKWKHPVNSPKQKVSLDQNTACSIIYQTWTAWEAFSDTVVEADDTMPVDFSDGSIDTVGC